MENTVNAVAKKVKFVVGRVYSATSACDSDCVFKFTVTKRTDKSVWLKDHSGIKKDVYRVKITEYDNSCETCSPLGSYAMAPALYAK